MSGSIVNFRAPLGGLNKRVAYQAQAPYTTPSADNVWPYDPIDGRARIGSRPGLDATSSEDLGAEIRLLSRVEFINSSNVYKDYAVASSSGSLYWSIDGLDWTAVSSSLALATDVQLMAAAYQGKLYIADYDDSGPAAFGTDGTSDSAGTLLDSSTYANWTDLPGDEINVNDYVVAIDSVGDGSDATIGIYQISSIHATNGITTTTAFASGSESVITFRVLRCPKIYDPSAGTLTRWIASASKGSVPCGHPIVTVFHDSLFLSGGPDAPHVWHKSRDGNPLDFLTSDTDSGRAVSGSATDAGNIGDPITAVIAHADICQLIFTKDQTWLMQGSPAFGGKIVNLSYEIGCVDKRAVCQTATNETVFLSRDGVYWCPRGCGASRVESLSRETIPEDLLNVSSSTNTISLSYDVRYRGVFIFIASNSAGSSSYYYLSWFKDVRGFWPMTYGATATDCFTSTYFPAAQTNKRSAVLQGGRDGKVRMFSIDKAQDNGATAIASHIDYLVRIGHQNMIQEGGVTELRGAPATNSGDIDWELRTGKSAQQAFDATAIEKGSWNDTGLTNTSRPRARGQFAVLRLKNGASNEEWSIEEIQAVTKHLGKRRA